MESVLYSASRSSFVEKDGYFGIPQELRAIFNDIKPDLDSIIDATETYSFSGSGIKILAKDCQPIRVLEYWKLLKVNDSFVGHVMLRVTNDFVKHGAFLNMDVMNRTYELRFKTFGAEISQIESSGIALTQVDDGPVIFNTGALSGIHRKFLEENWALFKGDISFDLSKPDYKSSWNKRAVYTQSDLPA